MIQSQSDLNKVHYYYYYYWQVSKRPQNAYTVYPFVLKSMAHLAKRGSLIQWNPALRPPQ